MDVQALELSIGFPHPGPVRPPGRRAERAARLAAAPPGANQSPGAVARRHAWLLAYTGVSIAAGLGALLWTTATIPVWPAIDPGLQGTALAGPDGGLLLWIAFGLIGSLRVLPLPGSSGVWTFHFPFIAAAMVLGGPTAGAWVGFLSTLERRELESQPWYGVLANHSVMAFAAVLGGLSVQVCAGALAAAGADPGIAGLVATAVGTVVLSLVANAMAAGTIMLREDLGAASLIDVIVRSIGRMTLAEVGLAWVFVMAATTVGWWAPLAISLAVLAVWPAEGVEFQDPLMKLPRMRTFERELDRVLARTRRGLAPGGLLLSIDLDGFGQVNKDPALGKDVGDEVLAEIGNRMRALMRATDFAGRLGGDELAMFYAGDIDPAAARRIARRLEASIRRPVLTSRGVVSVGVSIGALIVRPSADVPGRAVLMRWADLTMQEQKRAQKEGLSTSGVRFHRYGAATPSRTADADVRGDAGSTRGRTRAERLTLGAVATAGAAFVVTLAAVLARHLG